MNVRPNPKDLTIRRHVVGKSYPHDSADRHVRGKAVYIDDMPDLPGTLHIAPVLSPVAKGVLKKIDAREALKMPGVVRVLTAADVPGHNDIAPILSGEPVFADGKVAHVGQIVAAVVATSLAEALQAAHSVKLSIKEQTPCFDVEEAHKAGSVTLKNQHLVQGDAAGAMKKASRIFEGKFRIGGQDHFYLEGQIAYAIPGENGEMTLWSSTQHPTEVQLHVAEFLGQPANDLDVQVRRMGGGFGGKESQPTIIAAIAALGAKLTKKPCRFRLRRDDDMEATGKRHGYVINWQAGLSDEGRIDALKVEAMANAGHVADLSGPVVTRTLTHLDNCYHIPNADFLGVAARTNTVSNTAFRGFGGPQGMVAIEGIIDTVAREMGMDPNELRAINYYGDTTGDLTPYDQKVEDNRIRDVVDRVMQQADWAKRRKAIDAFNRKNKVLKKGLAMMPVKFGISFNLTALNQAGSLVHVYKDGSVHLNHGGTEMGQGLFTKVAQVVAEVFGLPLEAIKITPTTTGKVPNTSATAASAGSDLNGAAARNAAEEIKARMVAVAAQKLDCEKAQITFERGKAHGPNGSMTFAQLANDCWFQRVSLSAAGFYKTPKIHWDGERLKGRPFFYYTYGAAVAEVVIDTLTGENRCLRADIVQDCGKPLNPAIDLGQIEGAFVQGMGWLTCEELWWDKSGKLRTVGPSTYKIPGSRDVPPHFKVSILDDEPNREDTIFHSKAIGEPPLMLAISVWLALRDAVSSLSGGKMPASLDTPATAEAVLFAVEDMKRRVAAQSSQ
ncbi:xanthine dehydrogenase molybdopterin binding subunit [Pseudahrensia aquimaris]|uniref:Xanthine dehydrogenase molybdopterin binding subunit n=1 Tax=Pseudahrensia aquimaris TaxID=744461 RepID=A0ABW3FDP8_9HYPH